MTIIYTGRVFSVEVDRIRFPNGTEHDTAIVRHRPSVVVIPIHADGRIVLVRQYRPSIDRFTWELPAGGIEPGETAEAAAVRESVEETKLEPRRLERIRGLYPAPGFCDEELIFLRVSDLTPPGPDSPYKADPDEDIEVQAVTVDEARAMVARGDIVDLKTAYGLTLI
jgi:ADP-ribose pyrophosphatase